MRKVLIGCPYNSLEDLKTSFKKISKKEDLIFLDRDVVGIDDKFIYIGERAEKHQLESFTRVFIRYPYDLIDPHSENYQKRENTEFFKTLGLLFADISINYIKDAHFARNRLYSLKKARESNLKTPNSFILRKNNIDLRFSKTQISKSLGNCYFSQALPKTKAQLKKILSFEEDSGDTAFIYPPHIITGNADLKKHINMFGICFLQNKISGEEYRVFIVKNQVFFYKREKIDSLDKSSAELSRVKVGAFEKHKNKFKNLCKNLNLEYLCVDVILEKEPVVIDINPFGSFPEYNSHPEVVNSLARLLLK